MNSNGSHEQVDTVVIGGGIAGLAAATYVARAGRSVVVLERSSRLGGRAVTDEQGGFYFNLGPHALYKTGAGAGILKDLGVDYSATEPPQEGLALRDGKLYKLPASPVSMVQSKLLSAGSKLEFGKLFATIGFINADAVTGTTLNEWIEDKVRRDEVKDAVRALVRVATYTNEPDRVSAGLAISQVQKAIKGVLYLDRGWQTLVDALEACATDAGARIDAGATVAAIERDGDGVNVRTEAGSTIKAAAVVIATPPRVAADLLGPSGDDLASWADAAGPVRAATLDVGLSATPRPDARFVLGIDQPLYLSIHSGVADLAPEGGAMIYVAKYLGDDNTDAKQVQRELEDLLDLAQPGWRDVLVERRFLPNLTVVNALATADKGGLSGRPSVETDIHSVYLAGDWVGGEGWLVDASLASAKLAASAALDSMPAARAPAATGVA